MNPKQAIADLQKNKIWPVYYLYGEEPFKIEEFIDKLSESWVGSDTNSYSFEKIEAPLSTGNDVLSALQSMGLFSGFSSAGGGKRIVIVRSAHQLKNPESLAEEVMKIKASSDPWGGNLLVMVSESIDGRKKFHQWMKKSGYALEFKKATDAEFLQWIGILGKRHGIEITSKASEVLSLRSDGSLYRLATEIEKAWLITGGENGAKIDFEDVMKTASVHVTHEMVELVEAVIQGKKTRSLILCEKLIVDPDDALSFVGFVNWAIKNTGSRGGFSTLGNSLSLSAREDLLEKLIDVDLRLKSSGSEPRAIIEQFIVTVTE